MPPHRHRGRHPEDDRLFAPDQHERLRQGVRDLSWLLTRGYAPVSAVKLVGDRYSLDQRQRIAVARASCSDQARADRAARRIEPADLAGKSLAIDGFNVLLTLEAALADGVLLLSRDGCLRDMASVHGTYRQVVETLPAADMVAQSLRHWQPSVCIWYLDAPVSNSGRLAGVIRAAGEKFGLVWQVELVNNPDRALIESSGVVASADSIVLDGCGPWINLTTHILADHGVALPAIDLAS
jgi:hypothetical protein